MYYQRSGAGEAVFLLHGFASSSVIWKSLALDLQAHFDVISIDWPGFGASQGIAPYTTAEQFAEGLLALANKLGITQFHVLGHSMSGFIVQQLLYQYADSLLSAVLYGAGLKLDKSRRFETIETTLHRLEKEGAQVSAERVINTWFLDIHSHPTAFQICLEAARGMSVEAGAAAIRAMESADFTHLLDKVNIPSLIILGESERSHPPLSALELRAALPHAHLAILPFAAHVAHLEQPELFQQIIQQFLLQSGLKT